MNELSNTTPDNCAGNDSGTTNRDEHADCRYNRDCSNCPLKIQFDLLNTKEK